MFKGRVRQVMINNDLQSAQSVAVYYINIVWLQIHVA